MTDDCRQQNPLTGIRSTEQLGENLRAARKQLSLTQAQLALAAGVGVRFIVDLEAGKPTLRLAQVLRVIGELALTGLPEAPNNPEGERHGA